MKKIGKIGWAIAAMALMGLSAATAANSSWTNTAGGEWTTPENWDSGVPGPADLASFGGFDPATFTVSFTNDASSKLKLGTEFALTTVTFDLNGHTFTQGADLYLDALLGWTLLDGSYSQTIGNLYVGYTSSTPVNYSTVTIGAGGVMNYIVSTGSFRIASAAMGKLEIRDGGKLNTTATDVRIGSGGSGYAASVLVTGAGSTWTNSNGVFYLGNGGGFTSTMTVADSAVFSQNSSSANHVYIGQNSTAANAALNITSGGLVDMTTSKGRLYLASQGTGLLLISGVGSEFRAGTNDVYLGETVGTSYGTMIVEDGGKFLKQVQGSPAVNRPIYIGHFGNGEVIVRSGGYIEHSASGGTLYVGGGAASSGNLLVTGATSRVVVGDITVGQSASTGTMTIAGGGTVEVYRQIAIGPLSSAQSDASGESVVTVTGTNSVLRRTALESGDLPNANISALTSLGVGSLSSAWSTTGPTHSTNWKAGGQGALNVEDGGLVEINNFLNVFSNSLVRVDGGHIHALNFGMETGSVFQVALHLGDANASDALITATNEVRIWGATLNLELGDDFVYHYLDSYRLIGFTTLSSGYNRFAGLDQLSVINAGGVNFEIDYGLYDDGFITLTAIPEPGTLGLLGAGVGLSAMLRRRRNRRG